MQLIKTINLVNNRVLISVRKEGDLGNMYGLPKIINPELEKYGHCAFRIEVIASYETPQRAYQAKAELLKQLRAKGVNLYNAQRVMSEEHKGKISNKLKGRPGRPVTQEERDKISAKNKGRILGPHSKERKRKIADGVRKAIAARRAKKELK